MSQKFIEDKNFERENWRKSALKLAEALNLQAF